jgi:hypothetical protein
VDEDVVRSGGNRGFGRGALRRVDVDGERLVA